jgi:hypothetical protein
MREPDFGWRYMVDYCGNSSWLPSASAQLAELRVIATRRN